ncbi:hypothetical protein [Acinetobacter bereziniae]|uniref:hypothetical protein n=1 Tax=Acinetobacter bereziniae TaxID=106648 RepID=UPI00124F8770|nr:hypothetical protein [Acinetobacter bereziniae]
MLSLVIKAGGLQSALKIIKDCPKTAVGAFVAYSLTHNIYVDECVDETFIDVSALIAEINLISRKAKDVKADQEFKNRIKKLNLKIGTVIKAVLKNPQGKPFLFVGRIIKLKNTILICNEFHSGESFAVKFIEVIGIVSACEVELLEGVECA